MFLDTSLILVPVFISLWLTTRPAYSHSLAMIPKCDRGPGYTMTTLSKFLPFSNALANTPPWTSAPSLSFTIDGKLYNTTMDTGSTGVLISATDLVDYDPESAAKYPIGWQFFTSSFILQTGNWIPKKISFVEANVTATVPVLAVTTSVVCPWYNTSTDTSSCPILANGTEAAATSMPTGISYMGVGFGREYNGQPQGTPDKVPLLNIDSIDGQVLENGCTTNGNRGAKKSCLNEGYIISNTGVTVGLTFENTKGFVFVKLMLNHSYSGDPRDWTQTAGCISVNGTPCKSGSLLLDTGIPQAYLTIPPSVPIKLTTNSTPHHLEVADGQNITVYFGSEEPYITTYNLVVGDHENDMAPTKVIVTQSDSKSPFFNTGRHFYRDFDVLYDAIGGYLGLKWKGNTSMASSGPDYAKGMGEKSCRLAVTK